MPSPFYDPTTFNPGAGPSVTHSQLNKFGAGIESAHERIDGLQLELTRIDVATFAALASPSDGDEYLLEVPDPNRVGSFLLWHVKYRASEVSGYKWDVIAAEPLLQRSNAATTVNTTSYAALAAPVIDLPRAGDYRFEIAAWGVSAGSPDTYSYLAPCPNGQSPDDDEALYTNQVNAYDTAFNAKPSWSGATQAVRLGCSSGSCALYGRVTFAGKSFTYDKIVLSAKPIRLGQGTT